MASKNKDKEIVGHIGYAEVVGNPTRSVKSSGSNTVGQWKWDGVPIDEKHRVAWEDKSTGDYYRYNAAEKVNEDGYRRYINVSTGNKSTGYSAKFHAEEKYAKSDSGRYLNDY